METQETQTPQEQPEQVVTQEQQEQVVVTQEQQEVRKGSKPLKDRIRYIGEVSLHGVELSTLQAVHDAFAPGAKAKGNLETEHSDVPARDGQQALGFIVAYTARGANRDDVVGFVQQAIKRVGGPMIEFTVVTSHREKIVE
jgi:hypothetical protein